MGERIPPLDEWTAELLCHRWRRVAALAKVHGLDPWTGVRWYTHADSQGAIWMVGDAHSVVPLFLTEPTMDAGEALERALRDEATL